MIKIFRVAKSSYVQIHSKEKLYSMSFTTDVGSHSIKVRLNADFILKEILPYNSTSYGILGIQCIDDIDYLKHVLKWANKTGYPIDNIQYTDLREKIHENNSYLMFICRNRTLLLCMYGEGENKSISDCTSGGFDYYIDEQRLRSKSTQIFRV